MNEYCILLEKGVCERVVRRFFINLGYVFLLDRKGESLKEDQGINLHGLMSAEVTIRPTCIRFSLFEGGVYYHLTQPLVHSLRKPTKKLMGMAPDRCRDFTNANLGFLLVCCAVLIKGRKMCCQTRAASILFFTASLVGSFTMPELPRGDICGVVATRWQHKFTKR